MKKIVLRWTTGGWYIDIQGVDRDVHVCDSKCSCGWAIRFVQDLFPNHMITVEERR